MNTYSVSIAFRLSYYVATRPLVKHTPPVRQKAHNQALCKHTISNGKMQNESFLWSSDRQWALLLGDWLTRIRVIDHSSIELHNLTIQCYNNNIIYSGDVNVMECTKSTHWSTPTTRSITAPLGLKLSFSRSAKLTDLSVRTERKKFNFWELSQFELYRKRFFKITDPY